MQRPLAAPSAALLVIWTLRLIKVWTQAETSSSLGPANLVFCINLQENRLGKEKS